MALVLNILKENTFVITHPFIIFINLCQEGAPGHGHFYDNFNSSKFERMHDQNFHVMC